MTNKQKKDNIQLAINYAEEIKMLASSLSEDVADSTNMTEAWKKIDRFYQTVESFRNMQKCTGSKSFSILNEEVNGHTKYLQGIDLPIMVNSVWESENNCVPSEVCEMHIGMVNGKQTLLITPELVMLPQ